MGEDRRDEGRNGRFSHGRFFSSLFYAQFGSDPLGEMGHGMVEIAAVVGIPVALEWQMRGVFGSWRYYYMAVGDASNSLRGGI